MRLSHACFCRFFVALLLCCGADVSAVVYLGTDDPNHNTSAPDGELAQSGWQYLGRWVNFVGTVIGPHHFITARHVGGVIGQRFHFRGETYATRALYEFGPNDLRIWEVCEPMPGPYAPLYSAEDEVGKSLVVFGRGGLRGEEVWLDTAEGREHRGWLVGTPDYRLRWGVNDVTEIVDYAEFFESAETGELVFLRAEFDRDGEPDEAHLSSGDSGGAVFIESEEGWALAGVVFGANAAFNDTDEGDGYLATLFDGGGLYSLNQIGDPIRRPRESNIGCDNLDARGDEEYEWLINEDLEEDVANNIFATRVSHYRDWIQDVLAGAVEPCFEGPWAVSSVGVGGEYRFDATQHHDAGTRTIRVPAGGGTRFIRLTGCRDHPITSLAWEDGFLVVTY